MPSTASPIARITELARSFPTLADHPAVSAWDPVELDRWASTGASRGEHHAASFVLHVWNSTADWQVGRFDLFSAMAVWDAEHVAAFAAWVAHPFTL